MNKIWLVLLLFGLWSCATNSKHSNHTLSLDNAKWIGDNKPLPATDSLFYLDDFAPIFRKQFKIEAEIETAKLLITAAGYYVATLNTKRVGDTYLSPAWTDFSKRIYYREYDVTTELANGENCLGVSLGNGFYNPLPLKMWGRRNLRDVLLVGRPKFIAKLVVSYKNGSVEEIVSDESWKFAYGPLAKNSIYLGEVYDARNEIEGWNSAKFDDNLWQKAVEKESTGGKVEKEFFEPIKITEKVKPRKITQLANGDFIVDMGVNFTGTYKIRLQGNENDTIRFRFGERIYDDGSLNPMTTVCGQIKRAGVGGAGAPAIAWQTDSYILKNDMPVWFQPEFTYHTYRFMEISGLKTKPEFADITGLMLNSDVAQKNEFQCSSSLLNSIQEATQRTFLSNLVGVQSDCAAREKFGYGGDLNATSESFIYNFNMQQFYRKTIYDWLDAVNDSGFVDTAPFVGIQYCGISWESALLTTQYQLYLYYNDTEIVKELYEFDENWMDKVARLHPNKIVESGLSDHESLVPVPVELIGTTHYLQCANIMREFAKVMGDTEGEAKYKQLSEEIGEAIKQRFWDNSYKGKINKQTLFAALAYYQIVPENEQEQLCDSLLLALKNGPAEHFSTGIFGTKYILEAFSQLGHPSAVYNVVNSTKYPGWGFMIDRGATTIWETWKESDNTYSNCHPMFGSVTEWFYRYLGGIQTNPDHPGFKTFVITPYIPKDLDFVNCKYHSPYGKIVSNWKKTGMNTIDFEIEIPNSSTALFRLPFNELSNVQIQSDTSEKVISVSAKVLQTNGLELTEGLYKFSVQF